jgi:hypothetical protein
MFALDSAESALYGGVSSDIVSDQLKNQFVLHLGDEQIDSRIYVRISSREICFFYYDWDYAVVKEPIRKDTVYMREVGAISLTRPKDTGNDILTFPQNIADLFLYRVENTDANVKLFKSICDCNERFSERFWGFPFVARRSFETNGLEQQGETQDETKRLREFRFFLRCCLLCFVYEFEDRAMSFGESPIYDEVRDKLRLSDVYSLLSSKIHYTLYLYDTKHLSQSIEQYSFHAQKYADGLMDGQINKVILPDDYVSFSPFLDLPRTKKSANKLFLSHGSEVQEWFYNPEAELESILDKNRKHLETRDKKTGNAAFLKTSLVSKIRSFLYTKHAIYQAMTSMVSKKWFCGAQILMGLFNLSLIIALLFFKSSLWGAFFSHYLMIGGGLAVAVLVCIFMAGYQNDQKIINAFFPRIILAEAAAWLTIGIAEDLVKSMLWVKSLPVIVAIVIVLAFVCVLLFGESQQHSPYCTKHNITKTILVMNHSLFFALVLGCVMQLIFYDNLLRTSNVLSDVIYKEHFDNVEDYLHRLEDLDQSITDYRVFARDYDFGHTQLSGDNSGKTRINGNIIVFSDGSMIDSVALSLENRIGLATTLNPTSDSNNICDYHNALTNSMMSLNRRIISLQTKMNDKRENRNLPALDFGLLGEPVVMSELVSTIPVGADSIINSNLEKLTEIRPVLLKEIRETKNHLMDDGYDSLIGWATQQYIVDTVPEATESAYLNELVDVSKMKKCCVLVGFCKQPTYRFYPTLLLLHMLIVLVLAFFTQLIISEKTVTEPL